MTKTELFQHIRNSNNTCIKPNFIHLNPSQKKAYTELHNIELLMQVVVWKCTKCNGFYYET